MSKTTKRFHKLGRGRSLSALSCEEAVRGCCAPHEIHAPPLSPEDVFASIASRRRLHDNERSKESTRKGGILGNRRWGMSRASSRNREKPCVTARNFSPPYLSLDVVVPSILTRDFSCGSIPL